MYRTMSALALVLTVWIGLGTLAFAASGGGVLADPGAMQGKHFHPKGKLRSKFTIEFQKGRRATLPFEDKRDFEEAKTGFIAAPRTSRSRRKRGMWRGTWPSASSCSRARTSTACIPRCSARQS